MKNRCESYRPQRSNDLDSSLNLNEERQFDGEAVWQIDFNTIRIRS
jgi:hypothetical protein